MIDVVTGTEPTVLWRLQHPSHGSARAVVLPGSPQVTLTFFVDNVLDRAENFETEHLALFRADEIRQMLLSDGWREP